MKKQIQKQKQSHQAPLPPLPSLIPTSQWQPFAPHCPESLKGHSLQTVPF